MTTHSLFNFKIAGFGNKTIEHSLITENNLYLAKGQARGWTECPIAHVNKENGMTTTHYFTLSVFKIKRAADRNLFWPRNGNIQHDTY